MKAIVLNRAIHPPTMELREVASPHIGEKQVLIQVAACGVCHHDLLVMQGILRRGVKPNVILGHEISGTIVSCGELVTSLQPGDYVTTLLRDVCGMCIMCTTSRPDECLESLGIGHEVDGGFAEYIAVTEESAIKLQPDTNLYQASLYSCPIGIALKGIKYAGRVKPGDSVVITGASGGLGIHAIQIARASGCTVIAITTSVKKVSSLETFNPDWVFHVDDLEFSDLVRGVTEDQGAAVVFDTLGSKSFIGSLRSLRENGRLLIMGDIDGSLAEFRPAEVVFRNLQIIGVSGIERSLVAEVQSMVHAGLVSPTIDQVFRFSDFNEAFRLLTERRNVGRIVLVPD